MSAEVFALGTDPEAPADEILEPEVPEEALEPGEDGAEEEVPSDVYSVTVADGEEPIEVSVADIPDYVQKAREYDKLAKERELYEESKQFMQHVSGNRLLQALINLQVQGLDDPQALQHMYDMAVKSGMIQGQGGAAVAPEPEEDDLVDLPESIVKTLEKRLGIKDIQAKLNQTESVTTQQQQERVRQEVAAFNNASFEAAQKQLGVTVTDAHHNALRKAAAELYPDVKDQGWLTKKMTPAQYAAIMRVAGIEPAPATSAKPNTNGKARAGSAVKIVGAKGAVAQPRTAGYSESPIRKTKEDQVSAVDEFYAALERRKAQ